MQLLSVKKEPATVLNYVASYTWLINLHALMVQESWNLKSSIFFHVPRVKISAATIITLTSSIIQLLHMNLLQTVGRSRENIAAGSLVKPTKGGPKKALEEILKFYWTSFQKYTTLIFIFKHVAQPNGFCILSKFHVAVMLLHHDVQKIKDGPDRRRTRRDLVDLWNQGS